MVRHFPPIFQPRRLSNTVLPRTRHGETPLPTPYDDDIAKAHSAMQRGNLALAEIVCHGLVAQGVRVPIVFNMLGSIAATFKVYWKAVECFREELSLSPGSPHARSDFETAKRMLREQSLRRPDGRQRFLLIKAWGCGFCSDLDHVVGCLLLADVTGRTPIIHWGRNSLFRNDDQEDAWPSFFEPVSRYALTDLLGKGYAYFPPKWTDANLSDGDVNRIEGFASRMASIYYFNQPEDVAVADFFVGVRDVFQWIRPGHQLSGKHISTVYRELVKKYLKPRPDIVARVDAFAHQHFEGHEVLAVHVRGSDKPGEDGGLSERNQQSLQAVSKIALQNPTLRIFLLTEDLNVSTQYASLFGDRLITTDCLRTGSTQGIHLQPQASRARLGTEVMTDMYLATRCSQFVGVATSNVAAMILHLKDWPEGSTTLFGPNMHYTRTPFLFDR